MKTCTVEQLTTSAARTAIPDLCDVLEDCVEGGASVGFLWPLERRKSEAYWRGVVDAVAAGRVSLFVARDAGHIVGTAQLVFASMENQPHRGEISKVLVLRSARRRGIGEELMRAAEAAAWAARRTTLVLGTATPEAERLYQRLGWQAAGVVPDYALFPDGSLCATTFYWKRLA